MSIFISYAKEDMGAALSIYELLHKNGFSAWLDVKSLLPGQAWEFEIEKAIHNSKIFIACLSTKSVTKRGYVQVELAKALKALDTIPEGNVFIIPVRIDECEVPKKLAHLHWVEFFVKDGQKKLLQAISQYLSAFDSMKEGLNPLRNSEEKTTAQPKPKSPIRSIKKVEDRHRSVAEIVEIRTGVNAAQRYSNHSFKHTSLVKVNIVAPNGEEFTVEINKDADEDALLSDLIDILQLPPTTQYSINLIGGARIRDGITIQIFEVKPTAVKEIKRLK